MPLLSNDRYILIEIVLGETICSVLKCLSNHGTHREIIECGTFQNLYDQVFLQRPRGRYILPNFKFASCHLQIVFLGRIDNTNETNCTDSARWSNVSFPNSSNQMDRPRLHFAPQSALYVPTTIVTVTIFLNPILQPLSESSQAHTSIVTLESILK